MTELGMPIKDQVCSQEFAKRMKELGFKQNAYWSWYENAGTYTLMHHDKGFRSMEEKTFDAYGVAELGKMLPNNYVVSNASGDAWFCYKYDDKYNLSMTTISGCPHNWSEANARASVLICLAENNLITP